MSHKLLVIGSNTIHTYNFITLVKDYFDDILLLTDKKGDKEVSFNVVELDFRLKSLWTIQKIKTIASQFKPTHIHMHQANSYAFLTLLALRHSPAKKVLNAWGSDILINPKKHFLLKQIVKYNLKQADIVVADSDTVLNEAQKLVPHIKTKNINFGIDFLSCKNEKENIVYSNRLHKSLYNIDKIIISFSKFVKENKDWKLIIAGNGEDTEKLKNKVRELSIERYVEFVGFVDKKTNFEYYCKSKIYVSVPESDSISLSLIEAIVSGCIVFVSDLPSNREVVDSRTGFIVKESDNIPFGRYREIDKEDSIEQRDELKKLFSKEFNRQRYIDIYEN